MVSERAVELARKSGWLPNGRASNEQIALDPEFWKALGRALGWNDRDDAQSGDNWLAYAQDFGFFVLTGNNIDDYWRLIVEV